jgi:transposase
VISEYQIVHSRKWCKEFANAGDQAFPGKGHQTELEEKVKQLQRENEILRQERDILKKAVRIDVPPQQ